MRVCIYTCVNTTQHRPITPASYAPELSLDGEDAALLVTAAHHLVTAYRLLLDAPPPDPAPTHAWWALRCCVLRQRVLVNPSATLSTHIQRLIHTLEQIQCPALCIELALTHLLYGRVADAARKLDRAGALLHVELKVDGAMGVRTAHQQDAKAQLVVRVAGAAHQDADATVLMTELDEDADDDDEPGLSGTCTPNNHSKASTDVLPLPVLCQTTDQPATLSPLVQALLLAHAKHIQRATAADELRSWQMAPYVEAVLSQPRTAPALYYAARLLRARHERARSRTRARALMAYERLLRLTRHPLPLMLACTAPLPFHARLRREAADEMVSCGMVGDALTEYEQLQEYDALVACYRLLGKAQAAEALVMQRLEVEPTRASLYCTLGDLRNDDAMYLRALDVSGNRSVRALRALARSAMGRRDWVDATGRWEAALAINPLHDQGWFALGYCCLKAQDASRALQAFTRCVACAVWRHTHQCPPHSAAQLDPENAEAWNNIAAVHMQQERMDPAFNALGEALKRSRDNWRMWSNYATVAAATAHWPQALQAIQRVLVLTDNAELPVQVLLDATGAQGPDPPPPLLGQLLKHAAASSHASPALWQAYATYFQRLGETSMARECLLKALRAQTGHGEAVVDATCQLAEATLQGVEDGSVSARELVGVRLQLRGLVKAAPSDELRAVLKRVEEAVG